jgi:hypothetical protein
MGPPLPMGGEHPVGENSITDKLGVNDYIEYVNGLLTADNLQAMPTAAAESTSLEAFFTALNLDRPQVLTFVKKIPRGIADQILAVLHYAIAQKYGVVFGLVARDKLRWSITKPNIHQKGVLPLIMSCPNSVFKNL